MLNKTSLYCPKVNYMRNITYLIVAAFFFSTVYGQSDFIQAGPMVGYADMMEAQVWVQCTQEASVQLAYWKASAPTDTSYSEPITTHKKQAFTAHLLADEVEPGTKYRYHILVNGVAESFPYPLEFATPPLWQWREDPPNLSIALGSCTFINEPAYDRPGNPYGGDYEIFESIHAKDPDIMLWLGDNTYLREVDWYTRTGIIHRHTHTRSTPEMQALLASRSHYAIWDDHDYGPNNSDRSFSRKALTKEAFSMFWANPSYGVADWGGITSSFEWGDAQFFLLDNRSFRTPNRKKTETRTILGEDQLNWLIDALVGSQATFKFVCIGGQVLNTTQMFETYANVAPEERLKLLHTIVQEGIKNVIFLDGDRHNSEVSKYESDGITIYDITSSPLTSGSHSHPEEPNLLRVEGSYIGERNFTILQLSGPRKERKLRVTSYNVQGESLWSYEIQAQ